MKTISRFCIECGREFQAQKRDALLCGRSCSAKRFRKQHPKLKGQRLPRHCKQCGEVFLRQPGRDGCNEQHCSDECRRKSFRQAHQKFYERNPQATFFYHAKSRLKNGKDSRIERFFKRHPHIERKCQSCGESRVVDLAHKPAFARSGVGTTAKNTTPEKIWILCPTCHALIDRAGIEPATLGLK